MKTYLTILGAAAALTFSAPAAAVTYLFNLTGDYTASWSMDSQPDIDINSTDGFAIWDVVGNFPGASIGVADLVFYNSILGGGLSILDFYGATDLMIADGPKLYTGPASTPTFLTGTFELREFQGSDSYTLTISEKLNPSDPGAVPEPGTWVMLIAGFGLVGASMRRRRAITA